MSEEDQRPHVSDGKVMRAIWRPSDGNGDPDVSLYEGTRYSHQGHPTWKLYCGEAPANINGVFQDPPTNVYLDDRACFKVFHFPGYTGAERGKKWRHDFDGKGNVKPARKQRGRPALKVGGEVCEIPLGKSNYRFEGAVDLREVDLIIQENKSQANGQTFVVTSPPPVAQKGTAAAKSKTKIKTKRKASEQLLEGVDTRPPSTEIIADEDSMDFEKPKPSKKLKSAIPSADVTPGSVADFKARCIALETQLNAVAKENLRLHNDNRDLKSQLEQSKILYARSNVQLTQAHNLNNNLTAQLRSTYAEATPSAQKELEIAVLRNSASVYRTIAAQLWGQAQISTAVLDENAKAAEAIEDLTRALNKATLKVKPAKEQHLEARKEWVALGESMKVRMGEAGFHAFDKEAMANLDMQ